MADEFDEIEVTLEHDDGKDQQPRTVTFKTVEGIKPVAVPADENGDDKRLDETAAAASPAAEEQNGSRYAVENDAKEETTAADEEGEGDAAELSKMSQVIAAADESKVRHLTSSCLNFGFELMSKAE